jgi:molecular chaperone GrpE
MSDNTANETSGSSPRPADSSQSTGAGSASDSTGDSGTNEEPATIDPLTALQAELAAALAERDEFKDKWARSLAEFENYRRRIQREQDEDRKYQSIPFVRTMLPAFDGLLRAVQAASQSSKLEDLVQGVELVIRQFESAFAGLGAKPIPAVGQPFDPNVHEAIQQLPSTEYPAMTVALEVERGYTVNERVVRPSKVLVSSGPPAA